PSDYIPKGRLKEFSGDVSVPESAGLRYIGVIVSDDKSKTDGGAVYKKWKAAEDLYKKWYSQSYGKMNMWLGKIDYVHVQSDTVIVNLLCKHGDDLDYNALEKAIDAMGKEAAYNNGTVHLPKFGDWEKVLEII